MRLLIVRHGQTVSNAERKFVNDAEGLTEVGQRQVARLAQRLESESLQQILYSGSERTVQTLAPIARCHPGATVRLDPSLHEGRVGDWHAASLGIRGSEAARQGIPIWQVRPPNGESWLDMTQRAQAFLDTFTRERAGSETTTLLVGHGRLNSLTIRLLEGQPWEQYSGQQQPHASLSVVVWSGDTVRVTLREDVSFLPEDLRTR